MVTTGAALMRRWERLLRGVKTVGHIVHGLKPGLDQGDSEEGMNELDEADMGALGLRDVPGFRVGADNQAGDPRTVTKLLAIKFRVGVGEVLGHVAVPFLNVVRHNVIEPSAPIIPGDEDNRPPPKAAVNNGLNLAHGPIAAVGDILSRMFAQGGFSFGVKPGD